MKTGEFIIAFEEGLHARPAAELVRVCNNVKSNIIMAKDGMTIDPKSILGIMALGAAKGDNVSIEVDGEDEDEVFANICSFFEASKD